MGKNHGEFNPHGITGIVLHLYMLYLKLDLLFLSGQQQTGRYASIKLTGMPNVILSACPVSIHIRIHDVSIMFNLYN